jgi:hypothetical protein
MASIIKEIEVNADAGEAWKRVADAGGVDKLVGMITACRLEGDRRYCTMADGSKVVERVISIDHPNMRLAYTITEGPIPLEYHSASMQVHGSDKGTRLVWTWDFKPDGLSEAIEPILKTAADSIRAALA